MGGGRGGSAAASNNNNNISSSSNNPTSTHNHNRNFSRNMAAVTSPPGLPQSPAPPITPVSAQTVDYSQVEPKTWELSKADLATLLDLSQKLNLDGEITPVMAWGMVLAHPRLAELNDKDFEKLAEELTSKVRCFG